MSVFGGIPGPVMRFPIARDAVVLTVLITVGLLLVLIVPVGFATAEPQLWSVTALLMLPSVLM